MDRLIRMDSSTPVKQPLKRILSVRDVFFIAVGQIIGAGVVALTGVAIGMTGPSVVLAYLASALLVLIVTALIMMAGTTLPSHRFPAPI